MLRLYAVELGLPEPPLPWHANRLRVAALGAALDQAAGALAKIALDVALLAQTEVAEVAEGAGGGSSTMPQKRNPIGSALTLACSRLVHANATVLAASLAQEHERGVGAWHAEWTALSSALALRGRRCGGAPRRRSKGSKWTRPGCGRTSLPRRDWSWRSVCRSRSRNGSAAVRPRARRRGAATAGGSGRSFRDELLDDGEPLSAQELDALLDPETYLGSAEQFVDRALAHYDEEAAL